MSPSTNTIPPGVLSYSQIMSEDESNSATFEGKTYELNNIYEKEYLLRDLSSGIENKHCADCSSDKVFYVSWRLGVFICNQCASIHHLLGCSVSPIYEESAEVPPLLSPAPNASPTALPQTWKISSDYDVWPNESLANFVNTNNKKANDFWEKNVAVGRQKTGPPSSGIAVKEAWIRSKYLKKEYSQKKEGVLSVREKESSKCSVCITHMYNRYICLQ